MKENQPKTKIKTGLRVALAGAMFAGAGLGAACNGKDTPPTQTPTPISRSLTLNVDRVVVNVKEIATTTAIAVPTATVEPTRTPTATAVPTPTETSTAVPTATRTPEPTATATRTPEPTVTPTAVPTATATPRPTETATPRPIETFPKSTSSPVIPNEWVLARKNEVVAGDIISGITNTGLYDNNRYTGLVTWANQDMYIKAPWGATKFTLENPNDLDAALLANNLAKRMLRDGCGTGIGCPEGVAISNGTGIINLIRP